MAKHTWNGKIVCTVCNEAQTITRGADGKLRANPCRCDREALPDRTDDDA